MNKITPEANKIEDSYIDMAHQLLVTPDSRVWTAVSGEVQLCEGRVWVAVNMPDDHDSTYVEIKSEVRITKGLLWVPIVTKEFEYRKPEELADPTCSPEFYEYRKLTKEGRKFTNGLAEALSDKRLEDADSNLDDGRDGYADEL